MPVILFEIAVGFLLIAGLLAGGVKLVRVVIRELRAIKREL